MIKYKNDKRWNIRMCMYIYELTKGIDEPLCIRRCTWGLQYTKKAIGSICRKETELNQIKRDNSNDNCYFLICLVQMENEIILFIILFLSVCFICIIKK